MYVQMSEVLKEKVLGVCKKAEAKELETVTEPYKADVVQPHIEKLVEEQVWSGYLHLKPLLPSQWLAPLQSEVGVKVRLPDGKTSKLSVPMSFDLPPNHHAYNVYSKEWDLQLSQLPAEHHARLIARHNVRFEVQQKHDRLRMQIKELLDNCKSLNDAVARYPDLRLFVPQEYLTRLDKKQVRAKKGELPEGMKVEIDQELLTTAGVMAKLNGV